MNKNINGIMFIFILLTLKLNIEIINCSNLPLKQKNLLINKKTKIKNLNTLNNFFKKKNLVIGAFVNYSWIKINNFFISLIKAKFDNYDCVMFVGNITQDAKDKLKLIGVIIYDIPEKYTNYTLQNYRWKLYEDFLKDNRHKYNMVFTTDIRDSFFQKDIFKYYPSNRSFLGIFIEDAIIKHIYINCIWIKHFAGEENLRKIYHNRIICSGSLIGTVDKFIELCHILWKIIFDKKDLNTVLDQGALDYIIYFLHYLNDSIITKDNNGPLLTIALTRRDKIKLDKDDNVYSFDGQIAAVVHQYDRHPDIVSKVKKKFNVTSFNVINQLNKTYEKNYIFVVLFFIISFLIILLYFLFNKKKKKINVHSYENKYREVKIKASKNNTKK